MTLANGRATFPVVEDLLAKTIQQRMSELHLSFRKADAECQLPQGTMSSIVYGKSQRPGPEILQALSVGLKMPYKTLALAAYGLLDHDSSSIEVTPPLVPAAV